MSTNPSSAGEPGAQGFDFGNIAVLLGFITPEERDAVFRLQRDLEQSGTRKRFGELCLEKKLLTRQQLFLVLKTQGKRVLACRPCSRSYNIHGYSSREVYRCRVCEGVLGIPKGPPAPKVSDSILITQTELRTTLRAAPLPISPELSRQFPQFEILKQVGRGGMGTVFKAREKAGGRLVALKVLAPFLSADEKYIRKFFREAKTLQKLDHPNIVASYGAGEAGEYKYLLMEYVRGVPVSQILKKRGKLRENQALKIVRDVAQGLDYAWQRRIIHRDIKPHNIMVGQENEVKLCDLGLSKELGDASLSTSSSIQCTPAYASPEQIQGLKDCDCRSDIYSLGVTLYHMAVGKLPFEEKTPMQYVFKHLQQEPPDPLSVNPSLSPVTGKLILRMMEKNRERRPEPAEIARVLSRHLADT